MKVLHNELDVANELPDEFYIGKQKYKHKLLTSNDYAKFMARLHYYFLIMKYYLGEKFITEQDDKELIVNLNLWTDKVYEKNVREKIYDVFVLCFHRRKFYYEDIYFKSTPVKFLIIKPLYYILDKLHKVFSKRISFKYFGDNLTIVEITNIFLGIMFTQVEGVKKKVTVQTQAFIKMYSNQKLRSYMAKVFSDLERFKVEAMTDNRGLLLDPQMTKPPC